MRFTLTVVLVAVLGLSLVGVDLIANAGRVHRGVSVGDVPLGGRRLPEATAHLDVELARRAAAPVVMSAAGKTASVTATQVVLSYETTALARAAYAYGRSGDLLRDVGERVRAWVVGVELAAVPAADDERIDAVIATFAREVDVAAKDAGIVIEGSTVTVRPSSAGRAIDRDAAKRLLVQAFSRTDRTIEVPVITDVPDVRDEAASAAAEDARQMLSGDVKVVYDNDTWRFTPAEIARWVAFRRSDLTSGPVGGSATSSAVETSQDDFGTVSDVRLEAYIDPSRARKIVLPRIGAVGRPARDATFKVSGGRVSIVPSQDGVGPDIDALARELTQVLADTESTRTVSLRTRRVQPSITTAKARTMGVQERISRYTTTYSASNRPRVANIHLLADAIDGTLVPPGATFSFNGTIGPRTAEKGYVEAPAIVNGKLVPQLGGGICQVGTTLFNTIFESGLPVVERRNHSFYISHYPKGRDATVSWGGPDFKFKNDTGHWVLLVTAYSNSSLTIALYGTDPGYDVEAQVGPWENERPYKTEETKDPTLPQGARLVEDGGITGRSCTVKRIVKKYGQPVRTDTFRSVYRPKTEVVRVGTKPVPAKATTTTVSPAP